MRPKTPFRKRSYTVLVFLSNFLCSKKVGQRRSQGKGGRSRSKQVLTRSLQRPPLWKPHPFGQKSFTQPAKVFCGRAKLLRKPDRGCLPKLERGAVLFRKKPRMRPPHFLNESINVPLTGCSYPYAPFCRHSDGIAVGARTHEGEFRG